MAITLKPTDNVKLKNGSNVFVINKKDGTAAWRKCKPVTCIFDETKISEIQFSGEVDTFAYHSGDTVYIPCGDEYGVSANPKSGYKVITQDKIINLLNISSLTLSDFDPVTYTFEAVKQTYYTITAPAKTSYITSASLMYVYNDLWKTTALTTVSQAIQIDAGTNVYYRNITPASGYTVNYISDNYFTPTGDGYIVPALKVLPKKPTVTLEFTSSTMVRYTITNNNPTTVGCSYTLTAPSFGTITRDEMINGGKTYSHSITYASAPSSATIQAYLFVDEQAGTDVESFDGSSETVTVTATYTPATT